MKIFTKPKNVNGVQLMAELANVGIIVDKIVDFADGTIGFETNNEFKAAEICAAHNGTIEPPKPTVADKLASVGLNLDDLKVALGL